MSRLTSDVETTTAYGTFVMQQHSGPLFKDIFRKKTNEQSTTLTSREEKKTVSLLNHHDRCIILHFALYYRQDQFFTQLLRHIEHVRQEAKRHSYESALLRLVSIGQLARTMIAVVTKAQIYSKQSTIYQILSDYSTELYGIGATMDVSDDQLSLVVQSYLKPLLENETWLKIASLFDLTSYDVPCQLPEQYMRDLHESRMTEEGVAMRAIQSNAFVERTEQVERDLLCRYGGSFLTLMNVYRQFQERVLELKADLASPLVLELDIEMLHDLLDATERIFYRDSPLVTLLRDFYLTGSPDFQWLHRPHSHHNQKEYSDHKDQPHSTFFELAHLIRRKIELDERMLEWQLAIERHNLATSKEEEELETKDEVELRDTAQREVAIFVENSHNFQTLFETERSYVSRIFFDIVTRFTVTEALCEEGDSEGVAIDVALRKEIKERARSRDRRLVDKTRTRRNLLDVQDDTESGAEMDKTASGGIQDGGGGSSSNKRIVYLANYLASPVVRRATGTDDDDDDKYMYHYVRSAVSKH